MFKSIFYKHLPVSTFKQFAPKGLVLCAALSLAAHNSYAADPLEKHLDAREPEFAQVLYYYYQDQPYEALKYLLSFEDISVNASGTISVLLADLYAKYGLSHESDAAISRTVNTDVRAANRNKAWINLGRLLYQNYQDSLALNFLSKAPVLLTPAQEGERVVMVSNMLVRQDRVDEAIKLLEPFRSSIAYYQILAQYNLALAYYIQGQKNNSNGTQILDTNAVPNTPQAQTTDKALLLSIISKMDKIDLSSLEKEPNAKDAANSTTNLDTISSDERLNLKDRISLSLAYLYLKSEQPDKARRVLRAVRVDSPFSNQALLTMSHIYWQLKDYRKSLSLAIELSKRNASDPMVQEAWIMTARSMEERNDPNTAKQYRNIIALYKNQYTKLKALREEMNTMDLLKYFPVNETDPILLNSPDVSQVADAGMWAYLLDRSDVYALVQKTRQIAILQQKMPEYQRRLDFLKPKAIKPESKRQVKEIQTRLTAISQKFISAQKATHDELVKATKAPLDYRQKRLDDYLTQALLGLQRVESKAGLNP